MMVRFRLSSNFHCELREESQASNSKLNFLIRMGKALLPDEISQPFLLRIHRGPVSIPSIRLARFSLLDDTIARARQGALPNRRTQPQVTGKGDGLRNV